jgi:hypothetical protein
MQLIRLDTPEGRYYYPTTGPIASDGSILLFPSVTTVLKGIKSGRLEEIEAALGKEVLDEISKKAARRGSVMHNYLENYFICMRNGGSGEQCLLYTQKKTIKDLDREVFNDTAIQVGRDLFYNYYYEGYLDRVKQVLFTEKFIWSLKYKYSGTLDFAFVDKSASSKRDSETVNKYFLQGAAYSIAFEELYGKPIDRIEIWISSKDGIDEHVLSGEELVEKRSEYIHWVTDFHRGWDPMSIISKYYKSP